MADTRVQHRAGRDGALARLLESLLPAVPLVVTDDGGVGNPWRGYRACLSDLPDTGHVAILQDDTVVCRNFAPALELIAAANPDTVVALFASRAPKRTYNAALMRYGKSRYVDTHLADLVHAVALLWPVDRAREFLAWTGTHPGALRGKVFQSDDATITRWMQRTKQRVRVTIPSIVEHPDDLPSTVNFHRVRNGNDSGRVAGLWIGEADPLELDWSR